MKKKILIVIGSIVAVVAGLFIYASTLPADYKISRELLINANPEIIFPHVNSALKTRRWMPFIESDPKINVTYAGPEFGVNSMSSWKSEGPMGVGEAVIIESIPNQLVKTKLTYIEPMVMSQMAEISLTPSEAGTTVRWTVEGKSALIQRVFCIFNDMDKMVGGEFEKGLTKLKDLTETEVAAAEPSSQEKVREKKKK